MTDVLDALEPCVHCGFCLQACPTFVETGDEADSPRGRIVLMQALAQDRFPIDSPSVHHHLDRCLGCRACETACPAGVQYGHALEATRAALLEAHPTPPEPRVVLALMANQRVRNRLMRIARFFRPLIRLFAGRSRFGFAAASVAATRRRIRRLPAPTRTDARPSIQDRGTAIVFQGCIMEGLFDHVNAATARVLNDNGFRVIVAGDQGCCGALHAHAGERERARDLARANVQALRDHPDARIVINSAGCGSTLKDYAHLLKDDSLADDAAAFAGRVVDVCELLAEVGLVEGAPVPLRVAYDAPCHLQHAQRITDAPLTVLESVPGLEVVEHEERDVCCGSAGLYSVVQRDLSRRVLDRKVKHLLEARVDVVATGNPGCTMHIGAGLMTSGTSTPVVHPVELLDLSYQRAGWRRLG